MAKKVKKSKKAPTEKPPDFASAPPQITILSDGALKPDKWDVAGFELEQSLGSVYDVIRHPSTIMPMTIAIYGDWGTGKTSAMRWLEGLLGHWREKRADDPADKVIVQTVWFDPWKYHARDDVWRGLIAEVLLKSIAVENMDRHDAAKKLITAAGKLGGWLGRSFLEALKSIKVNLGVVEVAADKAIENAYEDYKRTTHPERAYLNEFEQTLKTCLDDWLPEDHRMVIFIDDLDRCLPDVALEVLEALKLYLNIPRLIFVVGLDRQVVDQIVTRHYEEQGVERGKAKDYLDKMFQVEVNVAPSQQQMDTFFTEQIDAIDALTSRGDGETGYWSAMLSEAGDGEYREPLESTLRNLAGQNPRQVKRLLNSALSLGYGATQVEDDGPASLRFVQGVQVFLIWKILEGIYEGRGHMVREDAGTAFFDAFSEAVRSDEDIVPPARERGEGEPGPKDTEKATPVSPFCHEAATAYGDPDLIRDLVNDKHLRRIMAVPFSQTVAALTTGLRAERTERPRVADMPPVIVDRIARQLGTPADSLTDDDLSRITKLDLSGAEIGDAECRHLAKLTQLAVLDLRYTDVGDAGCGHLAKLTQLKCLYLMGTVNVGDAGCGHLAKLTQLTRLYLTRTVNVGDAGCGHLAKLTQLNILDLERTNVGDAACEHLAKLTQLVVLDLRNTNVGDEGCEHLVVAAEAGRLSGLRGLALPRRVSDRMWRRLKDTLPGCEIESF